MSSPTEPPPRVAVCIATYRRPVMLDALLESLGGLAPPAHGASVVIVVVDNDAAGSARAVIDRHRATLRWPLVTAAEPERNIAHARNRGVALAREHGATWIAFVDDDERVSPGWLAALLQVQAETGADIVGGAVQNVYADGVTAWVRDAGLPLHQRHPRGTRIAVAETSNALVASRVFTLVPNGFDPRFGVSGGSDTHFFLCARLAGASAVWADDALVEETITPSRGTANWLLRRAFRQGNGGVWVARAALPARAWLPRRAAAAVYHVARGTLRALPAAFGGRAALVLALQEAAHGAGALSALAGYRYLEYTTSHGW